MIVDAIGRPKVDRLTRKAGKRLVALNQAILGCSTAIAVVCGACFLTGSAQAQEPATTVILRGTSASTGEQARLVLRGSGATNSFEYQAPPNEQIYIEQASTDQAHTTGFMTDVGDTMGYIRDNIIPTVMLRGAKRAVSDRNISYTMPRRTSLRYSMMHSANLYSGLRSGNAGVGDTVAMALRGSYSTRAKLQRAAADRARMHGSLTNFLPKITATVSADFTPDSASSGISNGTGGVTSRLEVSMPLYASGVNINTYRQSRHISSASDLSYLAEEHRVALEAVAAHINLRLNRRIERTLVSNVAAMRRIAHIAQKLYQAGDASRADIAIAQANVESARAEVDLARKTREETLSDYESLTGDLAPPNLARSAYESFVPDSEADAIDMAINNNPTLGSSMHSAQASRYAAKVERGRYGPKIDLYGAYNRDLYNLSGDANSNDWSVGVRLKIPLFDASMAPNVGAARHEALEAQYQALDQSRLIERQVKRQWTAYQSATRRVAIVQRQVSAVSVSVEASRREYQAGFRSITDVLNDQLKLARARITLESARHEKMLAAYEIAFTTAHPAIRYLASAD